MSDRWSDEDDRWLHVLWVYSRQPAQSIARVLRRSYAAVLQRASGKGWRRACL